MNRKPSWLAMWNGVLAVGALVTFVFWHAAIQEMDRQIARKRSALKGLYVIGRLPPNQEVTEYLAGRTATLEAQYRDAVSLAGAPPAGLADVADPQLFFQQRVHEVQRLLERLAAGRETPVPAQLGFPKELPPADAVPRFLTQLALIESLGDRTMSLPGVSQVTSFKLEDPQPLPALEEGDESFITLLPIRIKLTCTLDALAKLLGLLDQERPLMQMHGLRVGAPEPNAALEVEFVLARASVDAALPESQTAEPNTASTSKNKKKEI